MESIIVRIVLTTFLWQVLSEDLHGVVGKEKLTNFAELNRKRNTRNEKTA